MSHERDQSRQQQSVTYAAVGATQAPDLMQYPPAGYRPIEQRGRIGHGDERECQDVVFTALGEDPRSMKARGFPFAAMPLSAAPASSLIPR